ncbi:hypothetical protein E2C01_067054 [Portunus trituberculatus]|uniref:Uncharacterized protein n=1 Tax=Portunus trituberculatus TaxID=210409 RepID=A0A5B7HIT2_PORTR|nr:hypothetical protein [Portunus trituberculatus]
MPWLGGGESAADKPEQQQEQEENTQQQQQQQEEQRITERKEKQQPDKGEKEQQQQEQQQELPIHNITAGVPQLPQTALSEGNESLPEDQTAGRHFFGLLDPSLKVNLAGVKEKDLKAMQDIMHSVSQGVDSSLQPSKEDFWDVMRVLRLLKTHRWLTPDSVVHPSVSQPNLT